MTAAGWPSAAPRLTSRPSAMRLSFLPPRSNSWTFSRTSRTCPSASARSAARSSSASKWPELAMIAPSLHRLEVLAPEDVEVAGRGHEQLAPAGGVAVAHDREAVHQRLEGADRIDLDDRDVGAVAVHPRRDPLADPAVARDDDLAPGDEDVRGPQDAVERALAGAVAVVEQVLGLGLVDRHDREAERLVGGHRLEPDDAGRRLLGAGEDLLDLVGPLAVEQRDEVAAVVHRDLRMRVGDAR